MEKLIASSKFFASVTDILTFFRVGIKIFEAHKDHDLIIIIIIIIIIIKFLYCNWFVTRWQWLFYM